ncbi:group 3 secretory phospholipase A2 [Danio aesculapii]|uniref:group 3 secretory phospholipase A2 n=1 Tax=Danio aesculapii TaxID=1142201 RepID=UPI0024BF61F8|nr:group 3 secretory phospholipase A2 [Danio aesculapii]
MSLQDARLNSLFLIFNLLVVFSYCDASTFTKPAPFCLLVKTESSSSQVSFLIRSQDTSLLFYWSKWTPDQRVKECFVSRDVSQIKRYLSLCHKERIVWDNDGKFSRYNLTALLEDDGLCQINLNISLTLRKEDAKQNQQLDSPVKIRNKRAWVLPGTLWCGRGTNANDYEQLGMFEHADRCCREHDHCEHIIRSFSVNFGVFNPTFFTVSHCACDHRFKQCLLGGNDTISNMVGYSFFNVLKIRCFEFVQKRQCTQYNWLGLCTMVKLAPVAIMKDSTLYNSTNQTNETSATFELSCNEVPVKLTHSGEHKTSNGERVRLRKKLKTCNKSKTFQSQNQVNEKKKNLHRNDHGKGRKRVQLNSMSTFTLAPLRKTNKKMKMRRQKLRMETIVQKTPKATHSALTSEKIKTTVSQSKQMQASKSGAKTLRNKRKRGKSKIQKSSKNPKEKHHRNKNIIK